MNFRVGQRVVCVFDFRHNYPEHIKSVKFPVVNEIYTIRSIKNGVVRSYLRLNELVNTSLFTWLGWTTEPEFESAAFRPLTTFGEEICSEIEKEVNQSEPVSL